MTRKDKSTLHKELDYIQNCITRMGQNSFMIKGWTVAMLAIVSSLSKELDNFWIFIILSIFCLIFWGMDAFYLRVERKFKKMYAWVVENRERTDESLYDLDPSRFDEEVDSFILVMFSKTLAYLYGVLLLFLMTGIMYNSKYQICNKEKIKSEIILKEKK